MTEHPSAPDESVLGLDPRALVGSVRRRKAENAPVKTGNYKIIRVIARGGMETTYEARQVSLQRIVAVKMISSGLLATEAEVERFRREAEAVAGLDHPGIVPMYEVGEE